MKKIFCLAMLVILLMSCSTQQLEEQNISCELQTQTPTVIPDPLKGWIERWLEKVPCEAPCWENIIPGKTTAAEAERVFGEMSYVSDIQSYPRLTGGYGAIEFTVENELPGFVVFNPEEPKEVWEISPPIGLVKLSEVMRAYGEPSHIVAYAYPPPDIYAAIVYGMNIIYLNKGIYLSSYNHPEKKPDLLADPLLYVSFFPPTKEGLETLRSSEYMQKWEGMCDLKAVRMNVYRRL